MSLFNEGLQKIENTLIATVIDVQTPEIMAITPNPMKREEKSPKTSVYYLPSFVPIL